MNVRPPPSSVRTDESIQADGLIARTKAPPIIPFLKWAGGKRWIAARLSTLIGTVEGTYIEPFLGSAAIFFAVQPRFALLSDRNAELIGTYRAIRAQHAAVSRHLAEHQARHSAEYYYFMRDQAPKHFAQKAARFIYLNRTCWNGLYRVNLEGRFNVPIGTKSTVLMESDDFPRISNSLRQATIVHSDFEHSINQAVEGDVIFCDPPYTVRHNHNGFVKYNEHLFSWADQVRLRDSLLRARDRGARIYITNADHDSVHELYRGAFSIEALDRYSPIGGANASRGKFSELLITG